ncbi:MAG: 50S ribosomal protein L31 [Gammaproteobacteria bacterium GWE2_37_16]|nr:MAG: 50S ribosomal protein L31 [Gammaproteobacteria bacterium GWE2_37_16]
MKENIHPKYKELKVTCSCGNSFVTESTMEKEELHLDICANCHPFYTGKQKVIDTAGRVDRFKQKYVQKTPLEKPKKDEVLLAKKKTIVKKAVSKPTAKKVTPKAKEAEVTASVE